jgi:hypothetical protein
MNDAPTPATASNGPWRVLILDRDPADPKWILATVTSPGDVQPAALADEAPNEATTAWVADHQYQAVAFTPLRQAQVWRVDRADR